MYCNILHAWWSTQSSLETMVSEYDQKIVSNFTFLFNCTPVGWTSDSDGSYLKNLSIGEMVGAWCFGYCQAHQGLPFGCLLLRYSVLFTVDPYLCFIFFFISCSRRLCIDKLGVSHANKTSMCIDPHLN